MKNKVFKLGDGSNNSPGSVIGSVIGYPSITVPMGFLEDGFSYGIEILAQEYKEDVLLNVARGFEVVNKNNNVLSSLTPSLYEISSNTNELVQKYEELLDDKTGTYDEWLVSVREFFANYNDVYNKDGRALELLESLPSENDGKIIIFKYILVLIVILLVLRIIKVQFKRFLRRIRRKRKRFKRRR